MTTLYIEPFSGMAGDMCLSALCGLTDGYELIQSLPEKLKLPDGRVEIQTLNKNGIVCKHVKIIDLNEKPHSHHHHHHGEGGHHHHLSDYIRVGISKVGSLLGKKIVTHHHRGLKEINEIIDKGAISDGAKTIAKAIFQIIGKAESTIHNIPLASIHFHEVSGVDSILDIVGCAVLLDQLQVKKTYCDAVCMGFGMVKTQHGVLPVPAPATAAIMKDLPVFKGNEKGEKLTPTGAAILKYLDPDFEVPTLKLKKSAYGPGEKNFRNANVVRVSVVEEWEEKKFDENKSEKGNFGRDAKEEELIVLESNMDDISAEYLGSDFQNSLLHQGAKDFYYTSVQMKKGRPGLKISILTTVNSLQQVANFILEHTTTIGIRYYPVLRKILPRRNFEINTKYGPISVKEVVTPSGFKRYKIEHQSLQNIQKKYDISLSQLQSELYAFLNNNK